MAGKNNDDGINAFQTFSTLLALLLPILQFFFNFLPSASQDIFLFKTLLIPVTVIAGMFSYLLIIAFKNGAWFSLPFNIRKHRAFVKYQDQYNYIRSEPNEYRREQLARDLQKNPKKAPFYLNPLNIYLILIPLVLVMVISFLSLGVLNASPDPDRILLLVQAFMYILTISLTSLTLAVFYINETNAKNRRQSQRDMYRKIVQLLFDNNSVPGFPSITFVAQDDSNFETLRTYVRVDDKAVYQVLTDNNGDVLKGVEIVPEQAPVV